MYRRALSAIPLRRIRYSGFPLPGIEARDAEPLFDAGGVLSDACENCHTDLLVPLQLN